LNEGFAGAAGVSLTRAGGFLVVKAGLKEFKGGLAKFKAGLIKFTNGLKDFKAGFPGHKHILRSNSMAEGRDWVPSREQDLVELVTLWDEWLSDTAKQTAFGWKAAECAAVVLKIGTYLEKRAAYLADKSKARRLDKNAAMEVLKAAMRKFANDAIRFNDLMTVAQKFLMGVGPHDEVDTPQGAVADAVEMTVVNDPVPDSHTQIIHYKKMGFKSRAKAPWHMGVFQICIRNPGEPAPDIDDESVWSKDIICLSSPFVYKHRAVDVGKDCYYRAHWEAEDGKKGGWTMVRAMIP
jgi:hypothetical protein